MHYIDAGVGSAHTARGEIELALLILRHTFFLRRAMLIAQLDSGDHIIIMRCLSRAREFSYRERKPAGILSPPSILSLPIFAKLS